MDGNKSGQIGYGYQKKSLQGKSSEQSKGPETINREKPGAGTGKNQDFESGVTRENLDQNRDDKGKNGDLSVEPPATLSAEQSFGERNFGFGKTNWDNVGMEPSHSSTSRGQSSNYFKDSTKEHKALAHGRDEV